MVSGDLAQDSDRWPVFVAAALDAGFRSRSRRPDAASRADDRRAEPVQLQHRPVGEADQRLAQAFADVATIGILQQRSAHRSSLLAEQLQQALNSRIMVEQAKGVLAERHGVSMDVAFDALRRHARDHNLKIADAALAVVRGTSDIPPGPA